MTDREGLPIWYELLARDPDAAERFYTHVLGWSVERPQLAAAPDYRVLAAPDGDGVAGLMAVPPGAPMAPGWLFYLAADDVDATVERVTAAGGAVAMPATDIPEVGRIALVADPQGTLFYVMRGDGDESRAFRTADTATAGHAVWNELTAPDQDAALAFYAGLFGWRHEGALPMGELGDYKFVHSGTTCLGATMNSFAGKGPGWQFYFMVDDVDAAVERLTGAGGACGTGAGRDPRRQLLGGRGGSGGRGVRLRRRAAGVMDKVSVWLWCDGTAEEQAAFYTGLVPGSAITGVSRAPADYPAGKAGDVLTVTFTLAGRSFAMLNGGAGPAHSEAMSLQVDCIDQAEVDRCWDAILANGGTEVACGWIKDRWGVAWQIVPRRLTELMQDPVHGPKAMQAMMAMVRIDVAALERAIAS